MEATGVGQRLHRRFWLFLTLIASGAFAIEIAFLPRAGLQADELLFVTPFLRDANPLYSWHVGPWRIPVMIMDYVGAFKSWLYWPVFHVWPPGVWSVRLPVCLIGVATLILFGDLVRRVAGPAVALFSVLCLATDASFLLTNVYDWGPVALLIFSAVLALNLLCRYSRSGNIRLLCAAFLVAGIALWYKAVFLFPLVAIAAALAIAYFRNLMALVSRRRACCAAVCLLAGASPLIVFNIARRGATAAATEYIGTAPRGEKILMMRRTLDGRALEHYMFRGAPLEKLQLSGAPLPDLVARWYRESSLGPGSALPLFLLAAAFVFPFLRRSALFRPLLAAWLASAGVFVAMLLFRDAGAGPHHTVLVYPGPHFIVAASLIAARRRLGGRHGTAFLLAGAALIVSNLYLLERYYSASQRNGFSVYWTDGSRELSRTILARGLPAAFLDWGIRDPVRVETGDKIALASGSDPRRNVLYVSHCDGYTIDRTIIDGFDRKAASAGLRQIRPEEVSDPHGAPVFCLFQLGR